MKKFSKLIALLLLLAVVVSVFAVLPAFAADEAADAGIQTIFDLENGIGGSVLNDGDSNDKVTSAVARSHTDKNGVTYYTVSFSEGKSVVGQAQVQPFFQASPTKVYFKDGAGSTADSTVTDTVDYIVIDLDVGTDTNPLGMIQFQNRFYHYGYNSDNKWTEMSSQYDHPRMFGDVGEDVYFDGTKTSTKRYPAMQSSTEWAHITMIVDVSDGDGFRNAYLYYNGQYVATYVNMLADATFLYQIRLMIGDKSAPDYNNESFSFANYTIKAFEKGYDGDLATYYNKVGNANYPLSYFSDLAYCLEDLPENTVATITRANAEGVEETTAVTSFDDLDANLETGDKVTLYRDLVRKIVIPEGVEFDLNGFQMAAPLILDDYNELDWIIRDVDGNIYNREVKTSETDADGNPIIEYYPAKGAQVYDEAGKLVTDTLQAFWNNYYVDEGSSRKYCKIPATELKVTFLNDTTLKNTSNHSTMVPKNGKLIYDLNGKTVDMKSLGAHYFRAGNANTVILVTDGTINHSGSNNVFYSSDADSKMYTKDVTINSTGTLIDQRRGTVAFFDSNVNISSSFSVKSSQGYTSYFILDGSTLTATGTEAISVTSTSSGQAGSGAGRYGGMQNNVIVANSTVNAKSKAIAVLVHANEHDSASGVSKSNTNYSKIDIVNSTIKGTQAVAYTLNNLYSEYQKVDGTVEKRNVFADGLSSANTLRLAGATLDATYPIVKSDSTAYSNAKKATYKDANENAVTPDFDNYTFTLDVVASDSFIKADAHLIHDSSVKVGTTLNASELKLSSNVIVKAGQVAPTVNIAEGEKLVPASDAAYPYAITANYTTYTYKLGTAEPVEFYWYGTDTPDIARVTTLDSGVEGLYHYEWKNEGTAYIASVVNDFALTAKDNLSLVDYIYYNLYVDKAQYDAFADYISFSGAALDLNETIEIDGVTYYKLQAKNVNIADIVSPSITATVEYTTVYGDVYTADKELSIYDYTARILETSEDEASIALIEAVLNYIASAQEYKGQDSSAVRALIAGKEFAAPAEDSIVGNAPVEIAVQYGDYISWLVKATKDTTVTVAYTVNDEAASFTKALKAGEELEIRVKARDFANGITVTAGDASATASVAAYYAKLGDAADKAMVAAIYNYAIAAQNYKPAN